MMCGTRLVLMTLVATTVLETAHGTDLTSLSKAAQTTTVFLSFDITDSRTGARTTKTASGFIVSEHGHIITAEHAVSEWIAQEALDQEKNEIKAHIGSIHAASHRVEFLSGNAQADIAILKIRKEGPYPSAQLCGVTAKIPGDSIVAFGFPFSEEFTPIAGTISNNDGPGGRWTAKVDVDPGMSGGPVYDSNGWVIGIVQGRRKGSDAIKYVTQVQRSRSALLDIGVEMKSCTELRVERAKLTPGDISKLVETPPHERDQNNPAQTQIETLSNSLELPRPLVDRFLDDMAARKAPPQQLILGLTILAEQHTEVLGKLKSSEDPQVEEHRGEALEAINEQSDYRKAIELLRAEEEAELDEIRKLEAEKEKRILKLVNQRASRARVALLQSRYREAAAHFRSAREVLAPDNEAQVREYREAEADALWQFFERTGSRQAFDDLIALYDESLESQKQSNSSHEWAITLSKKANALNLLGDDLDNKEYLTEAISMYREALNVLTREDTPLNWAKTQADLANALSALGELETDDARLHEAVAAYGQVLEELRREQAPNLWAGTQNNLCFTLATLGRRENSVNRLNDAVAACRLALGVWSFSSAPQSWAITQTTLGQALWYLGEAQTGTERLDQAVDAYQAALTVHETEGNSRPAEKAEASIAEIRRLIAKRKPKH
jgi:tetratricopeptide (TPR) repeat protein